MSTLTIRLPDDKHERLKSLAESRKISMNSLIDELATIANHDAQLRFQVRARKGSRKRALGILDKLGNA